ncbi:MAG: single-stranded DNA-binding protein, partial [Actinobacteria bacterium]|nr:single-stranded DNA-binding protein [Actinomycetota bacterium]
KNGIERTAFEIIAESFKMLGSKSESGSTKKAAPAAPQSDIPHDDIPF